MTQKERTKYRNKLDFLQKIHGFDDGWLKNEETCELCEFFLEEEGCPYREEKDGHYPPPRKALHFIKGKISDKMSSGAGGLDGPATTCVEFLRHPKKGA